ncbi:MAG: T9SS type A sorting domain-containing protein [Chitinophagales bacterium]
MKNIFTLLFLFVISTLSALHAQNSIARQWNEKVLEAIRVDFARPTVHARNLFHTSAAMYDAWAVYDSIANTYFLGKTVHGYTTPFSSVPPQEDVKAAQEEAMSFAVYRIMRHRFKNSPGAELIFTDIDLFMEEMGYDITNTIEDYACGAAEMGNYIARHIIQYGFQDGSNEQGQYANLHYEPVNPSLLLELSGNVNIEDLNRWQPLRFAQFIDQSGNPLGDTTPPFLSPEWGQVSPFSLQTEELTVYNRDGFDYWVYHDPGTPPHWTADGSGNSNEYKWSFALVSIWSSHLDPAEDVLWDISPASIGNMSVEDYPTTIEGLQDFYDLLEGGDKSTGYSMNPKTGLPYTPQIVQRGDYARVLAEFWADGPNSETPPGHWFTILNYVNDHPDLVKKMHGQGEILDDLEWDVKAYFALGGAMHDVAVASWGIKGWYDYIRPISAIRGMAELGQSSDPNLPSYNAGGLPLVPGYIELIEEGDPLQGFAGQYIGEVKLYAWKGPNFIDNPKTDVAGVGWIRAKNWFPYQRPTFVTPPFAGYVSGHSTYSRAAAEVLTTMTGDPFFPGGMGEFSCPQNEFLVFEDGPSTNLTLQWATYRDASDQCSLSRIWGGIHPPADDMPGRLIGIKIGQEAFSFAESYFTGKETSSVAADFHIFPNPTACALQIEYDLTKMKTIEVYHIDGRLLKSIELTNSDNRVSVDLGDLLAGVYVVVAKDASGNRLIEEKVVRL